MVYRLFLRSHCTVLRYFLAGLGHYFFEILLVTFLALGLPLFLHWPQFLLRITYIQKHFQKNPCLSKPSGGTDLRQASHSVMLEDMSFKMTSGQQEMTQLYRGRGRNKSSKAGAQSMQDILLGSSHMGSILFFCFVSFHDKPTFSLYFVLAL